eukprot:scaffold46742_cov47-Phaeocystis_antarctica.AAC.4
MPGRDHVSMQDAPVGIRKQPPAAFFQASIFSGGDACWSDSSRVGSALRYSELPETARARSKGLLQAPVPRPAPQSSTVPSQSTMFLAL